MHKFLVVTLLTILAGVSLWGWGRTAMRAARSSDLPVSLTIALGLAVLLFLGGLLNCLHLAYAPVLDAVAAAGLVLAGFQLWKNGGVKFVRPDRDTVLTLGPLILAGWFLAAHLLPQSAFNVHDDLEKYFAHPVQMLARGTFETNPVNSLGAETLGGQAFLQAFVTSHFPLPYVGAIDLFFCALLCVLLAGNALPPRRWALGALLAQAAVLVINPQLVNIAAVFSATALAMAAMFLAAVPTGDRQSEPSAPLLALLYAGLIGLKTTLALFVGLHFLALAGLGLALGGIRLKWAARVPLWTLTWLSPWLVVHAKLYFASPPVAIKVPAGGTAEPFAFWSSRALGYDSSALHYTALAVGALALAGLMIFALGRRWLPTPAPARAAAAAGLSAGLVYFGLTAGFGPHFAGPAAALRYACPILLAVVPVLVRLAEPMGENSRLRFMPVLVAGLGVAAVLAFLPSARLRADQIATHHVSLAYFPRDRPLERDAFLAYNQAALDPAGEMHTRLAAIQAFVPAGEALGAWVMTPYWLDFRRNPVFATDPAGLSMRWSRLPSHVRYFLLEYAGFAVRPAADYHRQLVSPIPIDRLFGSHTLAFLDSLAAGTAAGKSHILYNDGSYVLLRLDEPFALQE